MCWGVPVMGFGRSILRVRRSPSGPHTDHTGNPAWLALMEAKEDDMSNWPISTCTLCGLRFSNTALLDLHIREDHMDRNHRAHADHDNSSEQNASRVPPGGSATGAVPAGSPASKAGAKATTAPRPRSQRPMTALRRVLGAIRYPNDELVRASEAIIRSSRRPQASRRPGAQADRDEQPTSSTRHGDRAA